MTYSEAVLTEWIVEWFYDLEADID